MIAFAGLLDRLAFATDPSARIALLHQYLRNSPDPERGYAVGLLTGAIRVPSLRPGAIRSLAKQRLDPALFAWSYAFAGDLSETVALMWPPSRTNAPPPTLAEIVQTPAAALPALLPTWLDASEPDMRLALLKLATARSRPIVPATIVRSALAALGDVSVGSIEQVWHGRTAPYLDLFAWLDGTGPRPSPGGFQPFMLADIGEADTWPTERLWRGDRIRIADGKVFSRHADDISSAHPAWCIDGAVLDGIATGQPPCVRLFDMLFDGAEDLRGLGFLARRARLEAWFDRVHPAGMALSGPATPGHAGTIAKHPDSPYIAGRMHGLWVKRPYPLRTLAAVLLYAEPGLYTVGLRRQGALVPVGRATASIAAALDVWVRDNTVARFGPVREVAKTLIVSVSYESVQPAPRRKAGIVLEGARIVDVLARVEPDDLDGLPVGF